MQKLNQQRDADIRIAHEPVTVHAEEDQKYVASMPDEWWQRCEPSTAWLVGKVREYGKVGEMSKLRRSELGHLR